MTFRAPATSTAADDLVGTEDADMAIPAEAASPLVTAELHIEDHADGDGVALKR